MTMRCMMNGIPGKGMNVISLRSGSLLGWEFWDGEMSGMVMMPPVAISMRLSDGV
jgi:hypothetical protein